MIVHHFTTPITTPFARKSTQIYGDLRRLWEKAKIKESSKKPEITGLCRLIKGYKIMIKVLFVCHGNICRSPMAEYVMKDLVRRSGREDEFVIASAATSREELGNPVYPPVRRKLAEHGIRCDGHAARQMTRKDYEEFGYLIGMDRMNLSNMARICGGDPEGKCSLLLAHAGQSGDVADPWYTGDFEATWQDVNIGCRALLKELTEKSKMKIASALCCTWIP